MKKTLTSLLILCGVLFLNAQNIYNFSATNEPYNDLVGSTSLNNGQVWDDPSYAIPLGFDFQISTHVFNTIYIVGWSSGGILSSTPSPAGIIPIMMPIGQDILDKGYTTGVSQSNISYKIDGSIGNEILKIEWNNVGFWDDTTENDFMNFQLWLYNETNIIEYRYGSSSINNPNESFEGETGPIVALFSKIDVYADKLYDDNGYILTGNPVNPTVIIVEPDNEPQGTLPSLQGKIPDGTVYRFTPSSLSTENFKNIDFAIYPNPATDYFHVKTTADDYQINLYNTIGQKVKHNVHSEGTIDVQDLPRGIYLVEIETTFGKTTKKIIIN